MQVGRAITRGWARPHAGSKTVYRTAALTVFSAVASRRLRFAWRLHANSVKHGSFVPTVLSAAALCRLCLARQLRADCVYNSGFVPIVFSTAASRRL